MATTYKANTAIGTDGFAMRHLSWIADEGLEALATLFEAMELAAVVPAQWHHMLAPLVPKKVAGTFRAVWGVRMPNAVVSEMARGWAMPGLGG